MPNDEVWRKVVHDLRKSAEELRESNPDAALMRCRQAMEAILLSIFEEKNGALPEKYISFPDMMTLKKGGVKDSIPKLRQLEFNTVQLWGNYGSHYQIEGHPTPTQVDYALRPLENLIDWRFSIEISDDTIDESVLEEDGGANESQTIQSESEDTLPAPDPLDWMRKKGYRCMDCGAYFRKWAQMGIHRESTGHGCISCLECNENIPSITRLNKHKDSTGHSNYSGELEQIGAGSIKGQLRYLKKLVTSAYELDEKSDGDWVNLAAIGIRIKEIDSGFKVRQWGTSRMSRLIEYGLATSFEIRKLKVSHSGKNLKSRTIEIRKKDIIDN